MTTPMHSRMRRHTRPAGYVSKSCQAEAMSMGRPGSRAFSFNGEFPEAGDQQPVEATSRRRNYMASHNTGSYQAVRNDETRRMPAINKYGVHFVTALGMLAVVAVILGGIFAAKLNERAVIMDTISSREARISELTVLCSETRSAIQAQSNDVNIRTEAVRIGLISSKGAKVQYLEGPKDAVITMKEQTAIQSIASIWGK